MPISNAHANNLLDADFASTVYLSLHTSSPGAIADVSTELVGLGYARQAVSAWTTASARTVLNDEGINYTSLPGSTVTHAAVWDAVSGGTMLYFGEFDTPVVVAVNGGLDLAVNDVAITLD